MRQIALIAGLIEISLAAGCMHDGFKIISLRNAQQEVSEDEVRDVFTEISVEWARILTCTEQADLFDYGQLLLFAPKSHLSGQTTVISIRCWANADRQSNHAHCKMSRSSMSLFRYRERFLGYSGPKKGIDLADLVAQFESSSSDFWKSKKTDLVAVEVRGSDVSYKFHNCGGCVETLKAYRPPLGDRKLIFAEETTDRRCY